MSKLLRRLGQAGKTSKGGHDPPLPPLEDYAASPLLSELPEECRAMVRKAGLQPAEAEQDFMVLLSCLYFELKHNPDLTAHVKALIRKHRRSARKDSPNHRPRSHHHHNAVTGAAEAAAETTAAGDDDASSPPMVEPAEEKIEKKKKKKAEKVVEKEKAMEKVEKVEEKEKTEKAVEKEKVVEVEETQAALPAEARLAAPEGDGVEATHNNKKRTKTKTKKKKKRKRTKKATAAVVQGTTDVAEKRADCVERTTAEEEEEEKEKEQEKEEGDESDGGEPLPSAPSTKAKAKTKTKTKTKAKEEVQDAPAPSGSSSSSQQPAAAAARAPPTLVVAQPPQPAEAAPETARPAIGGSGEARGRARGFSFSTFFRPSLSSPDLVDDDAAASSKPGASKKRFSASGLLRPSASPSGAQSTASSSPLAQPSPSPPGKKAAKQQRPGSTAAAGAAAKGQEEQGHHNNHDDGDHPALDAPGFPVREELFLLDNPAPIFSSKQRIGRGGFGDVYTGKDKTTNQVVAIKILKKPYSEHGEQICNELEILRSCRHDSIVNYLRSYLFKDRVWMVMEYCDGGSLQSLIAGVDLNEGQIANVLRKVLRGLDYLHKQNRIHRDIKADNILLNINGAVKVADLGLCAELKDGDDSHAGMVGSRYWMAPEVIKRERYNSKVDIWSLGAVAMEMAQQHPPYHGQPSLRVLFHLATKGAPPLKQPKKWSPEFQDFLAQCFIMDPDQRPSAEQLLEHPFIAKASPNAKLEQAISIVFLGDSLKMNGF